MVKQGECENYMRKPKLKFDFFRLYCYNIFIYEPVFYFTAEVFEN